MIGTLIQSNGWSNWFFHKWHTNWPAWRVLWSKQSKIFSVMCENPGFSISLFMLIDWEYCCLLGNESEWIFSSFFRFLDRVRGDMLNNSECHELFWILISKEIIYLFFFFTLPLPVRDAIFYTKLSTSLQLELQNEFSNSKHGGKIKIEVVVQGQLLQSEDF